MDFSVIMSKVVFSASNGNTILLGIDQYCDLQFCTIEKEKLENTKGVFGSRNPKDSQHTGQKENDKRTNNDLQSSSQKTRSIG